MPGEWTLNIDLLNHRDALVAVFLLLNPGRSQLWRRTCPVLGTLYEDMVRGVSAFFDDKCDPRSQQSGLEDFRRVAALTFQLEDFLRRAEFNPADTLAISTLATEIPWDLVPYEGSCLGHRIGVGLRIPTPPAATRPAATDSGQGRPQFLHVIADPKRDLGYLEAEAESLKKLIARQPELDYEEVWNPSPGNLASLFAKLRRRTPFFHFSGHIAPAGGLVLKGGILGIDTVARFFPGTSDQIVMLNGCDALWAASRNDPDIDLFQAASVAGAFLDAGAGAVIAPRSHIADRDAGRAAVAVWERVFFGECLGNVMRSLGGRLAGDDFAPQSALTYVLYGSPAARVSGAASVLPSAVGALTVESRYHHPILIEACGDARAAAEPRHLFAALTRRWIVASVYFELENNRYIETLENVRRALRCASPPPQGGSVALSPAARRVLEFALERCQPRPLDELGLLEGLALVNDTEVQCALETVKRGPRRIDAVLQHARTWVASGSKVPAATFLPDGFASIDCFLPGLIPLDASSNEPTSTPAVGTWDMLAALLVLNGRCAAMWWSIVGSRARRPVPPCAWEPGLKFHWVAMTESLHEILLEACLMAWAEGAKALGEGHLASRLAVSADVSWDSLPPGACQWLGSCGLRPPDWQSFLERLRAESLGWL